MEDTNEEMLGDDAYVALLHYIRTGEISAQVQQILEAVNDSYTKPREFDSTELGD